MIYAVMRAMIDYFGHDVRRINHALKVFSFASLLAEEELVNDSQKKEIVSYSALLHDIGIPEAERKYHSSAGPYQEKEGPPIARNILEKVGVSQEIQDRVCFIIAHHHTYSAIDGMDFQILVEADFLVNIFEDGMSWESVVSVRDRIMKTPAGIRLLDGMYVQGR